MDCLVNGVESSPDYTEEGEQVSAPTRATELGARGADQAFSLELEQDRVPTAMPFIRKLRNLLADEEHYADVLRWE
jgi:hypothetical protein